MSDSYEPAAVTTLVAEQALAVPSFAPADRPWDEMFLVCVKCANKIGEPALADGQNRIRAELKDAVRASATPIRTRVTDIVCLGVCPKERISVAHVVPSGEVTITTVTADVTGLDVLRHFRPEGTSAL